jgi:GNAT superfamily N-acetyltransferase
MAISIRPATAADVPQILAFIRALAVYERAPDAVSATEEGLLRDGFGPHPFYECLIAEHDGKPAGFALYFFNYSTWMGRPGIYLEDLFVYPEFRGLGIGKALLQQVAVAAQEKGCRRLQWEVLDWNTPAIDFYRAMGAEFLDEWRNVRLGGEAIARLAEGGSRFASASASEPTSSGKAPEPVEQELSARSNRRSLGDRVGEPATQPLSANEETAS